MSDDTIVAVEIVETEYGERLALDTPYEARFFINNLPFKEYSTYNNFVEGVKTNDVPDGVVAAINDFDFSPDYASYSDWDPDALGEDEGAWLVNPDTWTETRDFLEHCGLQVEMDVDL
jgi:hypothetical protein